MVSLSHVRCVCRRAWFASGRNQLRIAGWPHDIARGDDGHARSAGNIHGDRAHARHGARSLVFRRNRILDRPLLRIIERGADRGSDADRPATEGIQRHLLHPHARRGRQGAGFPRREFPGRPRAGRAGGDFPPQGGGKQESRALAGNAAAHRRSHAYAAGVPGLLPLHGLFDDAELRANTRSARA